MVKRGVYIGLAFLFLVVVGKDADARQGFWIGGGLASLSANGDLDGTNGAGAHDPITGTSVVAGKLSSGSGVNLDIGYGFNPYLGVELLIAQTRHTASTDPSLPIAKHDSTADVTTSFLGLRITIPAIENKLDAFFRIGLSGHTVKYGDYTVDIAGNQSEATFSGSGTGVGFGAEYFIGHVGVGAGYTLFSAKIDQASGDGVTGTLSSPLHENFGLTDITVAYHF